MGNLVSGLKKFLLNKNSITILGVLAGILVLYIGYNYRVNQKVKLISVLYAKEEIEGNTQLTMDMIGTVKVNSDIIKKFPNIVKTTSQITDADGELYYVNFNSTIPTNGFIYTDSLVKKDDKPDSKLKKLPDGQRYLYFEVDLASTFGNAITPGASIDIYVYIKEKNANMFGKLYSNVEVFDVVDSKWLTTSGTKEKQPDLLIVKVSEDDYRFLEKAKRMSGVELIPVPNNRSFSETEEGTEITSFELEMYIESNYTQISEE